MVRHYENVYDKPEKGVKKNVFNWGKNFSKTGTRTNCVYIPKKTYIRKFTLYGNNLGECNTNDLN